MSPSAAATVFATTELLEQILLETVSQPTTWGHWNENDTNSVCALFRNRRVNSKFAAVTAGSPALKRAMGIAHDPKANKMDLAMRNQSLIGRTATAMGVKYEHRSIWEMIVPSRRVRRGWVSQSAGSPFEQLQARLPMDGTPVVEPTASLRQVRVDSIIHETPLAANLVSVFDRRFVSMHVPLLDDVLTAGEIFDVAHAFFSLSFEQRAKVHGEMEQAAGLDIKDEGED